MPKTSCSSTRVILIMLFIIASISHVIAMVVLFCQLSILDKLNPSKIIFHELKNLHIIYFFLKWCKSVSEKPLSYYLGHIKDNVLKNYLPVPK